MDVKRLYEPAERILELGENEYVKLKLYPIRARYQIEQAKTEGFDVVKLAELVKKDNIVQQNEDKVIAKVAQNQEYKKTLLPDYDGGINYKMLVCQHGVDPDDHTFMIDEKTIKLDRAFWENLLSKNPILFNRIQREVEKFQNDYNIDAVMSEKVNEAGEQKGNS